MALFKKHRHFTGKERRYTMPRGVYDRTKTPEQRASEKKAPAKKTAKAASAAAPQKRKYTRKATAAVDSVVKSVAKHTSTPDDNFALMSEVRQNLSVLSSLGDKFSDTPSLKSEVSAHVDLLGKLREKVFVTDEPAAVVEDEEEAASVAAVSNGTGSYQGSVPLPPPPSVGSVLPPPPIPTH
jgi:hypothetical protein